MIPSKQMVPYDANLYADIHRFAVERNRGKTYDHEIYSIGYSLSFLGGQVVVSSVPWSMYGLVVFKDHQDAQEAARVFGPRIMTLL